MMFAAQISRFANRVFTMISYASRMVAHRVQLRRLLAVLLLVCGLMWSPAAQAQNCGEATTQGTAPASWQTYCWLNLNEYNDATARSAAGQNLSFTLPDGSTLSFNARVTGGTTTAYNAIAAPSWSGSAVGNSAFIGIPGRPVLYTASAGTRTIALTNITVTPAVGGGELRRSIPSWWPTRNPAMTGKRCGSAPMAVHGNCSTPCRPSVDRRSRRSAGLAAAM